MKHRTSLFERLFNDPDRPWFALACAVGFTLIPFAGAAPADDPSMFLQVGSWRAGLLFAPTMIIYTVAAASSMEPDWQRVYTSLRSVVMISDEAYSDLIDSATAVPLRGELLAVAVGAAFAVSRLANTLMNVTLSRVDVAVRSHFSQLIAKIHINHPYNDDGKQMLDRHLPIGEADIALLQWTLARTPLVEAVTLESHLPDEPALRREVDLLRSLVTH